MKYLLAGWFIVVGLMPSVAEATICTELPFIQRYIGGFVLAAGLVFSGLAVVRFLRLSEMKSRKDAVKSILVWVNAVIGLPLIAYSIAIFNGYSCGEGLHF